MGWRRDAAHPRQPGESIRPGRACSARSMRAHAVTRGDQTRRTSLGGDRGARAARRLLPVGSADNLCRGSPSSRRPTIGLCPGPGSRAGLLPVIDRWWRRTAGPKRVRVRRARQGGSSRDALGAAPQRGVARASATPRWLLARPIELPLRQAETNGVTITGPSCGGRLARREPPADDDGAWAWGRGRRGEIVARARARAVRAAHRSAQHLPQGERVLPRGDKTRAIFVAR